MTKRGHQQPNLDNQSQPNLFNELPVDDAPPAEEPTFRPPPVVRPLVKAQLDEGDRKWDRLDAQAIRTDRQVREEVGQTALTGDDIQNQEVKDIEKNAKPSSRSKKDRRHLGWRGKLNADGPPSGVEDARRTY
jgi:hypothetical protein